MSPDPAAATPVSAVPEAPPVRAVPGTGEAKRHMLIVLVMDRPGVLNRVASLMILCRAACPSSVVIDYLYFLNRSH